MMSLSLQSPVFDIIVYQMKRATKADVTSKIFVISTVTPALGFGVVTVVATVVSFPIDPSAVVPVIVVPVVTATVAVGPVVVGPVVVSPVVVGSGVVGVVAVSVDAVSAIVVSTVVATDKRKILLQLSMDVW